MRLVSLSLVGLLVGGCFDPTLMPSGDGGSASAGTSSDTGSSDGDASSSPPSDTTDDTGSIDDTSSSTGVDASWDEASSDTGEGPYAEWAHHREVYVSSSDFPYAGYQVELKLPRDAPFAPGGSDIRVVDEDGVELPIWFDDPGFGDDVSIWAKMDLAATTDYQLTIHYGNPDAPSVTDAAAVFELYDDFDALDFEAWSVATGDWIAQDGAIATDVDQATSTWSSAAPMAVEARLLWQGDGIEPSSGIAFDSSIGALGVAGMPVTILNGESVADGPIIDPGTWTRVRIERDEYAQVHYAVDGVLLGTWDATIDDAYRVHLGVIQGNTEAADVVAIDWLFVRQAGAPPLVVVGPEM